MDTLVDPGPRGHCSGTRPPQPSGTWGSQASSSVASWAPKWLGHLRGSSASTVTAPRGGRRGYRSSIVSSRLEEQGVEETSRVQGGRVAGWRTVNAQEPPLPAAHLPQVTMGGRHPAGARDSALPARNLAPCMWRASWRLATGVTRIFIRVPGSTPRKAPDRRERPWACRGRGGHRDLTGCHVRPSRERRTEPHSPFVWIPTFLERSTY